MCFELNYKSTIDSPYCNQQIKNHKYHEEITTNIMNNDPNQSICLIAYQINDTLFYHHSSGAYGFLIKYFMTIEKN